MKDRTEMTLSGDKCLLIENRAKERQNRSKQELLQRSQRILKENGTRREQVKYRKQLLSKKYSCFSRRMEPKKEK